MNNSIFMFPKPENEPVKGYEFSHFFRQISRPFVFIVLAISLLSFCFFCSCSKEKSDDSFVTNTVASKSSGVRLGNRLTNIYATGYMRALYRQMHNLPSSAATPVRTTHLYVKLHPEDTLNSL